MKHISKEILAYIAGIVDGDGCIRIKKSSSKQMVSPKYEIVFQVKMVHEPLIQFIAGVFDETYRINKPSSKKGRPLYCFQLGNKKAERAIKRLLPYLLLKREEAEAALCLRDLQANSRSFRTKRSKDCTFQAFQGQMVTVKRHTLSNEYIQRYEELYQKCRDLKKENKKCPLTPLSDHLIIPYIAGIIDSEGCLTIKKTDSSKHNGRVTPTYLTLIDIGMSDTEPLKMIQDEFGGLFSSRNKTPKRKTIFLYRSTQNITESILNKVLPYLIVKKQQAQILLSLRELQSRARSYKTTPSSTQKFPNAYGTMRIIQTTRLSDEYLGMCEDFRVRCSQLNRGYVLADTNS
jgi:hypothetical protein